MSVSTYRRPDSTLDASVGGALEYMRRVDAMAHVGERFANWFAPHRLTVGSPVPDMAVELEPGNIWRPALRGGVSLVTELGRQTVSGFTAPSAGAHRIDRVVVDAITGVATRVAGTEATGSPTATPPAVPAGKLPVCQVLLIDTDTYIVERMITDERAFNTRNMVGTADFDGSNDYMTRGADLSGVSDGPEGIFSCWFRLDGGDGTVRGLMCNNSAAGLAGIRIVRASANTIGFTLRNAAAQTIISAESIATYAAGAAWHNLIIVWKADSDIVQIYVDDVAGAFNNGFEGTTVDRNVDYTTGNWAVGGETDGGVRFHGCLAEPLFHPVYADMSVLTNRRRIIDRTGRPAPVGYDGSRVLGVRPAMYMGLRNGESAANFALNRGAGGDFAITGTLDTGSSSPSD